MNLPVIYSYRPVRMEDLSAVLCIQRENYPASMQEDEETIRSRLLAVEDTCWLALDSKGVCAYLFAYPSVLGAVTPLGGPFSIPPSATTLYLHDLAVSRRSAGQGVGGFLANVAMRLARKKNLAYSALVSVQHSRRYWQRLGYNVQEELAPAQVERLRTYPDTPWYMVKAIAG